MQQAYLVTRNGQECIVPLANLTKDELIGIAQQLRREATAHQQHAAELAAVRKLEEETANPERHNPERS